MKKVILLSFAIILVSWIGCLAQNQPKEFTRKGYQAWVKLKSLKEIHGLLWNVDSTFIEIKTDQIENWKNPDSQAPIQKIAISDIQQIRTKKVRAVLKGYGWGAIIGNSLGGLLAIGYEISEPGNDGYILLMPMLGMTGSITGIIAGAAPDRTFKINGDQMTYKSYFESLDKRAFWTRNK